jgi:hypothetical protein
MAVAPALTHLSGALRQFTEIVFHVSSYMATRAQRAKIADALRVLRNRGYYELDDLEYVSIRRGYKLITCLDLVNNVNFMVFLRQDIVLNCERLLRQPSLTEDQIDAACSDLDESLDVLENLMRSFLIMSLYLRDGEPPMPADIHKMLAETKMAIRDMRDAMGFNDTSGHYKSDLFSDPEKRGQVRRFCEEMRQTVELLSNTKLSKVARSRSKPKK